MGDKLQVLVVVERSCVNGEVHLVYQKKYASRKAQIKLNKKIASADFCVK